MLDELPVLVCDSDLHVAHLALQLCTTVSKATGAATVPAIKSAVLPKCLGLLQSSLLQGVALRSLLGLFAQLVAQVRVNPNPKPNPNPNPNPKP